MADTVKVQFTRTYTVRDEEGRTFKEGETCDLSRPSADHFIKRGAAVEVTGKPAKPKAGKPAEEAEAK